MKRGRAIKSAGIVIAGILLAITVTSPALALHAEGVHPLPHRHGTAGDPSPCLCPSVQDLGFSGQALELRVSRIASGLLPPDRVIHLPTVVQLIDQPPESRR